MIMYYALIVPFLYIILDTATIRFIRQKTLQSILMKSFYSMTTLG